MKSDCTKAPSTARRTAAATPVPLPAPAGPGATAGLPIWRFPEVVAIAAAVLLTASGNEAFFAVFSAYLTEFLGGSNGQVHEANAARDLLLDELPYHPEP